MVTLEGQQIRLSLDVAQWGHAVEALQLASDLAEDGEWSQDASDLATLLRVKLDGVVPGLFGGCT